MRSPIRFFVLAALAVAAGNYSSSIASGEEQEPQAGIGCALKIKDGRVLVGKVLPETPAARSNAIQVDDQILAVAEANGEAVDVEGLKLTQVVERIRGRKDTIVRLTIIPAGKTKDDARIVSLTRGEIKALSKWGDGKLLPRGSKAPDFKFVGLSDDSRGSLSQHAGKIVVLEFWASWCAPCVEQVERRLSRHSEHADWKDKVQFLAVSVDEDKEAAQKRRLERQWNDDSIVWAGMEAVKTYHVNGLPTIYLIDQHGKVAAYDRESDLLEAIKALLE